MLRKTCTRCDKRSFSSDASNRWICPYCQKDLTHVLAEPSEMRCRRWPLRVFKLIRSRNS
ncbi:hypothetical protein [Brevibacillus sp. H7]|uniref:hypothetical protein n=1 Tax=Brevibacillus sp. H7 TaxID=3349138 RepID=UPI0038101A60